MAAAKNAQLLLQMLPKQHTTKRVKIGKDKDGDPIYEVRPDKSTKVPQKVLDFGFKFKLATCFFISLAILFF